MNTTSFILSMIAEFTEAINIPDVENYSWKYDTFGDGEYILSRSEIAIRHFLAKDIELTLEMQTELNSLNL